MKSICLLLLLMCPFTGFAQKDGETFSEETRSLLRELDAAIENKAHHHEALCTRLQLLKDSMRTADTPNRIRLCKDIFDIYARFQTDSALTYLKHLEAMPGREADPAFPDFIKISRARVLAVLGLYGDAIKLLEQVPASLLDADTRLYYYNICRATYGWMADYALVPEVRKDLMRTTACYRDSIISLCPEGINRNIVLADKALINNAPRRALELSQNDLRQADTLQSVYIYTNMAEAYRSLHDVDKRVACLARAALGDIKAGTTEYMALQMLAQAMYENGDPERAYSYLLCSMEDANFCKARLRAIEVSNIFPIIDKAYKQTLKERRNIEHMLLYTLAVLAVLLIASLFYQGKVMRKLKHTRKELAQANKALQEANAAQQQANEALREANEALQESNANLQLTDKMKEEYIARYLNKCRDYLDTLEEYRRNLLKLAKARQHEELMRLLKSESFMAEEKQRFYTDFDEAFLRLFPHFIDRFNALLQPEARIYPKHGEMLTTELRIFALIRLGVQESASIAHFLNCSLATIYNYRSKIRNRSICPKNEFEKEVMAI